MNKQVSFLVTAAILMASIGTVALFNVSLAIAQSTMSKINMTAGGGKTNMTGNMTKGNMSNAGKEAMRENMTGNMSSTHKTK